MERGWRRRGSGSRGGGMIALLALQAWNEYSRLGPRKPPVTAGLLTANTLVYLRIPALLDRILPHVDQVWFNPYLILEHRDLKRFFLSAFYHIGESHLVYNMISLLWKGIQLETSMGSSKFAVMIIVLLSLSQGVTVVLAKGLLHLFDYRRAYYQEYAIGFSGVLFAMKVVLNSQMEDNDYTNIHGLVVPARHAAWAELILIQMFVPGASFLGHLGGILAGILYLKIKASFSGSDPLAAIARCVTNVLSFPFKIFSHFCPFQREQRRVWGSGTVDRSLRRSMWRCQACTFDNPSMRNVCEMCDTRRNDDGLVSPRPSNYSQSLPMEELRRMRVQRFSR